MARGRVPATGKINAIVLAFKAAISPVGGTADKRAGNRHSPALCHRCTQAGVPPIAFVQGVKLFLSSGVLLKKKTTPHLASLSTNPCRISHHCLVFSVTLLCSDCAGLLCFGSWAPFPLLFKLRFWDHHFGFPLSLTGCCA